MARYTITIEDATKEELVELFGGNVTEITETINVVPTPSTESEPDLPAPVEKDVDGLPWDERIHASSKITNKDGKWKRKKGVDEITYITVKNELLGAPTIAPTVDHAAVPAIAPTVAAVPAIATPDITFEQVMQKLNDLFTSGVVTPQYMSELTNKINAGFADTKIANIMEINGEQELIDFAWETLEKDGHA